MLWFWFVYKATKQAHQIEVSLHPFLEPQPTDVTDEQNHDPQAEKSTWCSVLQAGGRLSSVCRASRHCGWTVSPKLMLNTNLETWPYKCNLYKCNQSAH